MIARFSPSLASFLTLTQNELRLRTRRLSTLVALLAVIMFSWSIIADPAKGHATLVIDNARVLYTSSALSLTTALMASPLFALLGFYLIRGRIGEDLRSGVGSVIAATPVGNARFLLARWLGAVVWQLALIVAMLGSIVLLQMLRGEGPLQLWVYALNYGLILLPMVLFGVSMAILFDSIPFLMGKAGDVLYFILWALQLGLISKLEDLAHGGAGATGALSSGWLLLDFSGLVSGILNLQSHLHTTHFNLGASPFDPKLAPLTLPTLFWPVQLIWLRLGAGLLALLPLLPAGWLFHRYSPDKVKARHASTRRTPLQMINQWLLPLARRVQPLFTLAAALPAPLGPIVADVALTLASTPAAVLALLLSLLAALFTPVAALAGLLVPVLAFWGVLISDIATRDANANLIAMTGTVAGGTTARYWRTVAAANGLGWLFMAVILVKLALFQPLYAIALVSGIFSLSAVATLLGQCSRTPRTFLALFLFWLYVALNARGVPLLDVVGFNHAINGIGMVQHGVIGVLALAGGRAWLWWENR